MVRAMKPPLVVSRQMPPGIQARLEAEFSAPNPGTHDLDLDRVLALLEETAAEALLVSSNLKFTAEVIVRLPARLRILATASVGHEHIDVAAAQSRGLLATNTPDVLTDCTADLTMLLILGACRRATEYAAIMRDGWRRGFGMGEMLGQKVSGRTLGIVGFGRIGQAVARRARGFDMPVLYTGPRAVPGAEAEYVADLDALLPQVDVLTLHAPATAQTAQLMDARRFALMRRGAVFVNASRGALVDEEAMLAALESGQLFAAGLDVFHNEPAFDTRFAALPNVFATPHMGSATVETRLAMGNRALDNIAAVLAGRPPIDPLWT